MLKRAVAAAAWFVSTWWVYALFAYFVGLPAGGGVVIGALLAAFVAMDPAGVFWGPRVRNETKAQRPDAVGLTAPTH